jgi:hypothetical protein
MADKMIFHKTGLTSGGAGCLDSISGANRGDTNPLQTDDAAFTMESGVLYTHLYDETSTAAESSPDVIRPDDIAAIDPGRWLIQSPALTIADASITNAKLAHIATSIIKGRVAAGTGDVEDLSASNVRTIINVADGATANDMAAPGAIGETTPNTIRGKNKEIFKTASADSPLTAAECSGTIVSNYGMTDADCTIDLPTAVEGLSFVAILPTVQAHFFKFHCPTAQADKIYLLGVAGSDDGSVGVASGYATGASASFFTFKASDGGYDWFCIPIFGTWVAS